MIIYIGETSMNETSRRLTMVMSHDHQVVFAFFAIDIIGAAINDTTTGLIPLNMRITMGLS